MYSGLKRKHLSGMKFAEPGNEKGEGRYVRKEPNTETRFGIRTENVRDRLGSGIDLNGKGKMCRVRAIGHLGSLEGLRACTEE